jgi:hypothetical protein
MPLTKRIMPPPLSMRQKRLWGSRQERSGSVEGGIPSPVADQGILGGGHKANGVFGSENLNDVFCRLEGTAGKLAKETARKPLFERPFSSSRHTVTVT